MARKPGRPRKIMPELAEAIQEVAAAETGEPALEPHPADIITSVEQWDEELAKASPALELHPSDREASREARTETRHGVGRSKRVPLGVPTQRLQADVPKGMHGHWMSDTPGRLQRALEGGYEFISSDGEVVQNREGCRSEIVGTGREGGAMKGYLMAIPTALYEQDQAAKASKIQAMEDSIIRGEQQQAASQDAGRQYVPSEGINIRHTQVDR